MVSVLGLDIGGANTKAAYIQTRNGNIEEFRTVFEYFPFWKRDTRQLVSKLSQLREKLAGSLTLDCVGVTMTAELSDTYRTKREGVNHILDCVGAVFVGVQLLVLNVDAVLQSVESARVEPLGVAAANWAATGWMVAQKISNCVVVDVGSTSTSIIPITDGKVAAAGKTDLEKLMNGELVFTGSLRTNVASIVNSVPLRGNVARVASELFAQSGDVHLVLDKISESDYTSETADKKGKTRSEALDRLARVVCADSEMMTEQEIIEIAKYVSGKQVEQIADGLIQVYSVHKLDAKRVPVVITGFGRNFLAKKAAEKAGVERIIDLDTLIPSAALASPAAGVALMVATKLEGRHINWMR